jgi:hypothetical protein
MEASAKMSSYPLLDVFLTMFWFFMWILWIFLVVKIIMDIFASHDLGGWSKAGWVIFVVLLPFLGVFVYLISRGSEMNERNYGKYRYTAPGKIGYDDLSRLSDLRNRGVITEAEFQRATANMAD